MNVEKQIQEMIPGSGKKLTKWENEPTVSDLKNDLTAAKSSHSTQVGKIGVWLDNLKVTGGAKIKKQSGRSTVVPKLIRKQAEWRYAALSEPFLDNADIFKASPVSWEDKKAAQQNELVLNYQFRNLLNRVKLIDDYVRTAVDEGTAILRIGWDFEEKEVETAVPLVQEVPIQDPQMLQQAMEQGAPLTQEVQVGTEQQMVMTTIKNHPTVEICNYNNIIIDPTCNGDIDKAAFIIYSFDTSLSELEKDGKYENLDQINVEGVSPLSTADHSTEDTAFTFKDKPRKKIVAFEYWGSWDIDGSGIAVPIVATWIGDVMIRLEKNPFPDEKLPFVIVQYLPVRNHVYGEPDGELLDDNQKILGAVTRGMIDIMGRSANGQTITQKGALDVTNARKFAQGLDCESNGQVPPRDISTVLVYPEIPNSAQFMVQLQNQEAESLTGVKAFHGGISGDALGASSATAARGVMDAASKREMGILRRLANGMVKVGKKICSMNAEFLSEEETVRITNEEFEKVAREDLKGNFDVRLDISTIEADNSKAQELSFMLQTMGNTMPQDMSQIILADIARLRKMPELSKRIEEYKPEPDPMQQKQQELEMAKLEAEIQALHAKAAEHQANASLDNAKARDLDSGADLKDLDFLEQESGVKQERDLEKAGAQANANREMKREDRDLELRNKLVAESAKPTPKAQG